MKTRMYMRWIGICLLGLFMAGCANYTYEAEEWHVAIIDSSTADVAVRYIGIGAKTTDPEKRSDLAIKLQEIADGARTDVLTPRLNSATQRVYIEKGQVVLEETGTMPNPLSWFAQTGFDPRTWFGDPLNLAESGQTVVKRDLDENRQILATNGQVTDESTFRTMQVQGVPIEFGSDYNWQQEGDEPVDRELQEPEMLRLIMWPAQARLFYWKFSGAAFNEDWQSLTPEFSGTIQPPVAEEAEEVVTETDEMSDEQMLENYTPAGSAAEENLESIDGEDASSRDESIQ